MPALMNEYIATPAIAMPVPIAVCVEILLPVEIDAMLDATRIYLQEK